MRACRRGHELEHVPEGMSAWRSMKCDICACDITHTARLSCEPCDFDVCIACGDHVKRQRSDIRLVYQRVSVRVRGIVSEGMEVGVVAASAETSPRAGAPAPRDRTHRECLRMAKEREAEYRAKLASMQKVVDGAEGECRVMERRVAFAEGSAELAWSRVAELEKHLAQVGVVVPRRDAVTREVRALGDDAVKSVVRESARVRCERRQLADVKAANVQLASEVDEAAVDREEAAAELKKLRVQSRGHDRLQAELMAVKAEVKAAKAEAKAAKGRADEAVKEMKAAKRAAEALN